MHDENNIRLNNFIPLSNLHFELTEDEDTGLKHLFLEGIAHGFKPNLKNIVIRQTATRKAAKRFKQEKEAGRIFQVWIDHAYINFFGSSTPSEKVIGHVDDYRFSADGSKFKMDVNPDHPSQIHKAILRKDIDGISIGADVKHKDLYCSVDGKNMFGGECDHYMGQTLENGEKVLMEIDDYSLDELTVTAKQADPEGKINFSELSNNKFDSSITFSLDTYDKEGKLMEKGIKLDKEIKGDILKKTNKYDKVENNMEDDKANVGNDVNKDEVSLDMFNQLVGTVATIKQSVDTGNNALAKYLEGQEQKEADAKLTQKTDIVEKIMAKSEVYDKEELLALDQNYLEMLDKAIPTPVDEDEDATFTHNQDFGYAKVPNDDKNTPSTLKLSRDDVKAWFRLRMGYKTPQAPRHIQMKVKSRLSGELNNKDDGFLQFLLDKSDDGDNE